jgi:glycosyltransferase involved in cell wall biosynthesis
MSAGLDTAKSWVVYVGPFAFPEGGAAARRILGNAQSLVAAGYQVLILSGQTAVDDAVHPFADGIFLASTSERDAEHLPSALRMARYIGMGARSRRWLDGFGARPDAVILYSGYTPYILQLKGWCRRRRTPLIFDAVEWYTAASPSRFLASPYLWQTEFAMRVLTRGVDGIVAISRFLETYYVAAGVPVRRVPPTLDVAAVAPGEGSGGGPLSLVYAGTPGQNKDQLNEIVAAVLALDRDGERLVLNVYGPTADEVLALRALVGRAAAAVVAHGPVTQAAALRAVGQADFSVLTRRPDRVSTAGFPTKFVESLAVGTPVIANLTSDLDEHLIDGVNGLVCDGHDAEAVRRALERALVLTACARARMRAASRHTAETAFDYRGHARGLQQLVEAAASAKDASRDGTGL